MKANKLSFWAIITFILLLTALHFLKPEIDPTWRFISEYALGRFGLLMSMAYLFSQNGGKLNPDTWVGIPTSMR